MLQLQKGEALFSPGKKAEHLYLLLEGLIRVFKPNDSGGEDEIALFTPGDTIGDYDFARNTEYDAYAETLEDTSLVVFPRLALTMDDLTFEAPHLISKIFLNSTAMVSSRIKETRKLFIENVSLVQELYRKAYEDPSTGLWNQSFLTDEINRILEDPMALIMLKPDRFKILVDTLGHKAGDEAMIKIASILTAIIRKLGRGWALRFRSNETGILINKCDPALAESLASSLSGHVAALPKVPLGEEDFLFSGSIAWGIWPADDKSWNSLFDGTYQLLMDTWKAGGQKIIRYKKDFSA
jgi:diguanylate cyclase (GGDEF)-like protein